MGLIEPREGSNQLLVLSVVAEMNSKEVKPRQRDIVEECSLTKGAVSNNCKKLMKEQILVKKESKYEVNKEKLMELYRHHIENYLNRESKIEGFEDEIERVNSIRTRTNISLKDIFSGESRKVLEKLVEGRLIDSRKTELTNTLKEVFLMVDQDVQRLGEAVRKEEDEISKSLKMLAVSMSRVYQPVSATYPDTKPETTVTKMAEELEEDN